MQSLYERQMTQCVNVIILSDHGMEDALCNKSVDVMSMLNNTQHDGQNFSNKDFITDEDFILRGVR